MPLFAKDSLAARRWRRFRRNRRGYYSLVLFSIFFFVSLFAEFVSNDKPFVVYYQGHYYFPIFVQYPETTFGGDFATEADYRDPYILDKITADPNWAIFPPNPHSYQSINL